jgi:hypothetical protein
MLTVHLVVLSVFVVASLSPKGRLVVGICTLIPAAETVLLFHFIGVFIGTILLAIATAFFIVGGILLPQGYAKSSQSRES